MKWKGTGRYEQGENWPGVTILVANGPKQVGIRHNNKMVELRNVELYPKLSEETVCFTAEVWFGAEIQRGKVGSAEIIETNAGSESIGFIKNEGRGGPHHFYPDAMDVSSAGIRNGQVSTVDNQIRWAAFEEWAKTLPMYKSDWDDMGWLDMDDELVITLMLEQLDDVLQLKKECRKHTVTIMPDNKAGDFTVYNKKYDSEFEETIRHHYPQVLEIVNKRFLTVDSPIIRDGIRIPSTESKGAKNHA